MISSFRDLDVWKGAVDLAVEVYRLTRPFPVDERFGLTSQLRRAANSVASNIAEGHARNSTREFVQFVSVALGSLAELETQWTIASRVGLLESTDETIESLPRLRAQLLNLRSALLRRANGVSEFIPSYEMTVDLKAPVAKELRDGDPEGAAIAVPVPRAPCPVPRP